MNKRKSEKSKESMPKGMTRKRWPHSFVVIKMGCSQRGLIHVPEPLSTPEYIKHREDASYMQTKHKHAFDLNFPT